RRAEHRPGDGDAAMSIAALRASELDLVLDGTRALIRRRIAWLRATWPEPGAFAGLAIGHDEADRLAAPDPSRAAAAFADEDPGARAAGDDLEAIDRELAAVRGDSSAPAPLAALAVSLGLGALELDVLALAVSAELDPAVARLCAYLQDDARRPHLTVRL